MSKLADYSDRFDEMRQAVLTITLRDGTRRISYPAVSSEVGVSVMTLRRLMPSAVHLPRLGMQLLDRRERARLGQPVPGELPRGDARAAAWNEILRSLPCTPERAEDASARRLLLRGFPDADWARSAESSGQVLLAALADRAVPEELPDAARGFEVLRLVALVVGATESVCTGMIRADECVPMVRRHLEQQFVELRGRRPTRTA
ncbi:MAG: hypothetical protein NTV23_02970 [Propionibacteriales bacterium]|nr:hypothetical protein [Propionibacteriales bacterium]